MGRKEIPKEQGVGGGRRRKFGDRKTERKE